MSEQAELLDQGDAERGRQNGLRRDAHELYGRRGGRNLALGGFLLGVVCLIFAVTIVKLAEGIDLRGFDHTYESVPGAPSTSGSSPLGQTNMEDGN